jgi:2-C-methyl-D-erythritol 4-phosphate cytidylyltransferase
MSKFAVILPAAGSSTRFGGTQSKLVAELAGLPVIARAVLAFAQRGDTHQILIAVPHDPLARAVPGKQNLSRLDDPVPSGRANEIWEALSRDATVKNRLGGQISLVPGGTNRAESVRAALRSVAKDVEFVAIHDAARPIVSQDLIDRTLAAAIEYGAAAPALPVGLTIKQATAPLPAKVQRTIPRDQLFAMQTPQIIRRDWLEAAYEKCVYPLEQITDDLQLLELTGHQAWLVPGEPSNIKITTPMDLRIAEAMMRP